ncbi:MAG: PilZ domain-containing protein [bacterium]
MTKKFKWTVETLEIFKKKFIQQELGDIIIPRETIEDFEEFTAGSQISFVLNIEKNNLKIELNGDIQWKRPSPITLPHKKLPAGLGIKLNDKSIQELKPFFPDMTYDLEDMNEQRVGGNYIKIRRDFSKKKKKSSREDENRTHPRIPVAAFGEVFFDDESTDMKVIDISLAGMGFYINEPVPVGEEILVIFEDEQYHKKFFIRSKVVRHLKIKKKTIGIAVRFLFSEDNTQKKALVNYIARHS